jgi:lipoprotein NlpI
MMRFFIGSLVLLTAVAFLAAADAPELLQKAKAAAKQGQLQEALKLADEAVAADAKSPAAVLFRGELHEALANHEKAVADFGQAIALDPKLAEAYNHRGSERFKLGQVAESLTDFDKYLELRPREKPGHWKRGISLYYAGKYKEGKEQFEAYEQVDTNDVENAVWHYICNARAVGPDKARAALLKIGKDQRVPMMEVYSLFGGKAKPADVMAAAKADDPPAAQLKSRLFYAHLYLGIYHDILGEQKLALEHLTEAAEKYRIGHYMGDVAKVHLDMLKKEKK